MSGSTAYGLDLVYLAVADHASVVSHAGRTVVLHRRASSPYEVTTLAAALRCEGLVEANVASARDIRVVFRNEESATAFAQGDAGGFDLGPFEVERQEAGRVLMRARGQTTIRGIEILQMDGGEEWRRLMAHEIDVIPTAAARYRSQLAGIHSIRAVDLPTRAQIGLFFNTSDPALADSRIRRGIASAIDARAVARIACGDPGCAVRAAALPNGQLEHPLPAKLSIIGLDTDTDRLACAVVQHQLRSIGIDVAVELLALDAYKRRGLTGSYQLGLFPVPIAEEDLFKIFTSDPGGSVLNLSRYANPGYDAAVKDGDYERAREILARDVPAIMLYEMRRFAAVDARFCGGEPDSAVSWRWLAELYPCGEEKVD